MSLGAWGSDCECACERGSQCEAESMSVRVSVSVSERVSKCVSVGVGVRAGAWARAGSGQAASHGCIYEPAGVPRCMLGCWLCGFNCLSVRASPPEQPLPFCSDVLLGS